MAILETMSTGFKKARLTNQTSASYVSKVPTATEPSGDANSATGASVIDLRNKGSNLAQNGVLCVFYGTGADDTTFSCRVIGWRSVGADNAVTMLWIPVKLLEVDLTIGAIPGVALKTLVATERLADTIALTGTSGNDDVSVDIVSPADDTAAHLVLDVKGFEKLELSFKVGTATDCNALISLF